MGKIRILSVDADWPFFQSPAIIRREDFGALLNLRGSLGNAVEIGTHRGLFAEAILEQWHGKRLFCVDPWQTDLTGYADFRGRDRNQDFEECKQRLAKFGDRVRYMRMSSLEAVSDFPDGSLGLVYIDGNHRRPYVDEDIRAWWPKVAPQGIFAGHDLNGDYRGDVAPAVAEFSARENVPVFYLLGDAASWFCINAV